MATTDPGAPGSGSLIHVPRRTTVYLFSTKNLVGSALGLVGLGLFFTGIVGGLWPIVVIGLYGVGALLTPGNKTYDLHSGWDPSDVRKANTKEDVGVVRVDFRKSGEGYELVFEDDGAGISPDVLQEAINIETLLRRMNDRGVTSKIVAASLCLRVRAAPAGLTAATRLGTDDACEHRPASNKLSEARQSKVHGP